MKMRLLDTFTVVSLWIGEAKETLFKKVASKCQQKRPQTQLVPD
jgi:hypothetical protein